jgi:predicted RNA binding protein YcfA (HicA-like mRNA interferase family)
MTKLPVVKGRECIRALQRGGFILIIDRQKGSYVILIRDHPFARTTIPNHNKPLKPDTLRTIIRDAGLTIEEFIGLL